MPYRMKFELGTKSVRIVLTSFLLWAFGVGITWAENSTPSLAACLPPISGSEDSAEDCPLTYRPPPPLGQSIDVSECLFLPEQAEALGQVFLTMQCAISNRSNERVVFFKYGIRYMELGSSNVLVEVGFEGAQRFSTAHLVPVLQPQETRSLRLVAPDLPRGISASELDISVEVLGVSVLGSSGLR